MLILPACATRKIAAPVVPEAPRLASFEDTYIDLVPGHKLTIVVPFAGLTEAVRAATLTEDREFTLKAKAGYTTIRYAVDDAAERGVALRFVASETTVDGKTTPNADARVMGFTLPMGEGHVRLVYLIRVSAHDHNMAVLSTLDASLLDDATRAVQKDANACGHLARVTCTWVPMGVALRADRDVNP